MVFYLKVCWLQVFLICKRASFGRISPNLVSEKNSLPVISTTGVRRKFTFSTKE